MMPLTELNGGDKLEPLQNITFEDGYSIKIEPFGNGALYTFYTPQGKEAGIFDHTLPLMITERSNVGIEIKKHLDPAERLNKKAIGKEFESVKRALNNQFEIYKIRLEEEENKARLQDEQDYGNKIIEAQKVLEYKEHLLIYVASLVSWMTAGERSNIMLTWIAYCSQVILGNPISVIGLGEGASGKTHIQEVAMKLISTEYIRNEKSITEAAMFNRAKDDPYYYDGCIVNYGDLGGINSQDFIMEAKNLLKELQSDGAITKPLNIATSDEGWKPIDITLYGHPSLTYTTVPGFKFDDQEMSRSIFITPRMDNRAVFNARKQILELKHGRTYKQFLKYRKEIRIIPYLIEVIKEHISGLTIINPYTNSVIDFLGESEYFKRDFDKYNGILKTITALNSYTRPTFDLDGETVVFTSLNDIQLFISLLQPYHESISVNISPKAAEILDDIRSNLEDWDSYSTKNKFLDFGITTTEYMEHTKLQLSKRSIQRYFGELNAAGFLKVTGKLNAANQYQLTDRVSPNLLDDLMKLSEEQRELIKWELGPIALGFIEEDVAHEGLDIFLHDEDVDVPGWERKDHLKRQRRKVRQ